MSDVKDLLKMLASPVLIAGAAGFGARYGNKRYKWGLNPWIAGLGGAAIGYIAGKGIQSWVNPAQAQPAPEQIAAAAQAAAKATAEAAKSVELQFPEQSAAPQLPAHQPQPQMGADMDSDGQPDGIFAGSDWMVDMAGEEPN